MKDGLVDEGLPETMFAELFLHLSLLLGFPMMLDGLARLREIVPQKKRLIKRPESQRLLQARGTRALRRIYGTALDRLMMNLESLHTIVPGVITRDVYGKITSRPGLSLREREIVNVVVLSIQGLDQQLYSHLRGALRVGVEAKTLCDVIRFGTRIARISPQRVLTILSTLTRTKDKL